MFSLYENGFKKHLYLYSFRLYSWFNKWLINHKQLFKLRNTSHVCASENWKFRHGNSVYFMHRIFQIQSHIAIYYIKLKCSPSVYIFLVTLICNSMVSALTNARLAQNKSRVFGTSNFTFTSHCSLTWVQERQRSRLKQALTARGPLAWW